MCHFIPAILLFVVLLSGDTPLTAQSEPRPPKAWVAVGVGAGDLNEFTVAWLAEVVAQKNRNRIALRATTVAEFFGPERGDIGLLYGRAMDGSRSHGSISGGVAWVRSSECPGPLDGGGSCRTLSTLGFPASATMSFRLYGMLGFGIQGFVNLNPVANFGGAIVIFEFGRLR